MKMRRMIEGASHVFCALLACSIAGLLCEVHLAKAGVLAQIEQEADALEQAAIDEDAFHVREITCLTDIVIREAGGESTQNRKKVAVVYIARRDDKDPQWPKTICEIRAQKAQVSQIDVPKNFEANEWRDNYALASEVYWGAWTTVFLPAHWECVRYYKVKDKKVSKLKRKQKRQLGILKGRGLAFFSKLLAVETPPGSDHTFYRDPNRCVTPLPTMASAFASPR